MMNQLIKPKVVQGSIHTCSCQEASEGAERANNCGFITLLCQSLLFPPFLQAMPQSPQAMNIRPTRTPKKEASLPENQGNKKPAGSTSMHLLLLWLWTTYLKQ
jgi:hypothetical protein